MTSSPRAWSAQEDRLLRDAVAEYGEETGMWKSIAHRIPGRTNKACRKRWLHSLSPRIKKTPWTPEEDALLLSLYAIHKPTGWALIAKHIPGRTDDACSKRYREALDPQLKKDGWSAEEDAKLLHLTTQLGSKWTQVGQAMGRSGLGCRNRWRLLERKQRHRNAAQEASYMHPSETPLCVPQGTLLFPPGASSSSIPERIRPSLDQPSVPDLISAPLGQSFSLSLVLNTISTSSSLSGALESYRPCASLDPSPFASSHPAPLVNHDSHMTAPDDVADPAPPLSVSARSPPPPPGDPPMDTPVATPRGPRVIPDDALSKPPRKRPRLRGPPSAAQDVTELPRLSSHLPATQDRTVLPYACGHPSCWPGSAGNGPSRFATASEVAEHRRLAHSEGNNSGNASEESKPFRCALHGCGKGWKNINGIQYHLQISKAHFKAALSQTRVTSDSSDTVISPETARAQDKDPRFQNGKSKEHHCPHAGCTNTYKQRTGLQYHLAHGHPTDVAQLGDIPPSLMRMVAAEQPYGHASAPQTHSMATPHPAHEDMPEVP